MKKENIELLEKELIALDNKSRELRKNIEQSNKEEILKKLYSYVGKYFNHIHSSDNCDYIHVIGVDEKLMRNIVVELGQYGKGINAWYQIEIHSSIYDIGDFVSLPKKVFDARMERIKNKLKAYL